MTKFILHGGVTSKRNKSNRNFFEEIVKDLPNNPKILVCLFAIEEKRWKDELGWQKKNFRENLPDKKFELKLASKEGFVEEVEWADAIHMRGGSTSALLQQLKKHDDLCEKFSGKTVSGSSAGAYALAMNSYENDSGHMNKGLGCVKINVITHWNSTQYPPVPKKVVSELEALDDLKLHCIRETEFEIFKQ